MRGVHLRAMKARLSADEEKPTQSAKPYREFESPSLRQDQPLEHSLPLQPPKKSGRVQSVLGPKLCTAAMVRIRPSCSECALFL
jgi:hypothetical protein